jgi:hypothetical protein
MVRYFLDVTNGVSTFKDEAGATFSSLEEARANAVGLPASWPPRALTMRGSRSSSPTGRDMNACASRSTRHRPPCGVAARGASAERVDAETRTLSLVRPIAIGPQCQKGRRFFRGDVGHLMSDVGHCKS